MQDWDAYKNGKLQSVSQKFSLKESIKEIYELMCIQAHTKGIFFIFDQDYFFLGLLPDLVIGDSSRFQQVAINLISNAIANTHEGGVTVLLSYQESS
jgi:two-component system sensor histidine kinase BarA